MPKRYKKTDTSVKNLMKVKWRVKTHIFFCHSEEMFSNLLKTQFVLPVKKKEEKRKKKHKRKTVKKGEADFALTDACM